MKKTWIWTALVVMITVFMLALSIFLEYDISRKTDSFINRAQVAADREDMLDYLQQLTKNLKDMGMTEGHLVLIWKKPDNDMGLHYKTILRLQERLESIKDIPKNETAYQVALDDIRGTIRELPNPAHGICWVKYDWKIVLFLVVLWLFTIALWLIGFYSNPQRVRNSNVRGHYR